MSTRFTLTSRVLVFVIAATLTSSAQDDLMMAGDSVRAQLRGTLATTSRGRTVTPYGSMTPVERRQAVDALWGSGEPTEEKLRIFDKFWSYVDAKYAAFQNLAVDWSAMRARYRSEVANGVSRGRFAAIMNQMALALREPHTTALDLPVNAFTVPEAGVPLMAVGDWTFNQSGACSTAQPDGSALVYSAMPGHPLGLQRGDRVLGYDGRPWRELYQELLEEELPLWPLVWGGSPTSFAHTFESSATMNWHLFETMDVAKPNGQVIHVPTNQMPGPMWFGFCSEQMAVSGVPKPADIWEDTVSSGVMTGTEIGYVYVWGWGPNSAADFENALRDLTQVRRVSGLIIDFRYNAGGFMTAPHSGISVLFPHPVPTTGIDERSNPVDHLAMKNLRSPSNFILDFRTNTRSRSRVSYEGPIALLTGPGAGSTGDFASLWMTYHPNVRTFGKPTASAFNLQTQPALGTELDLGPDWFARIAEANFYRVGSPHRYLTHTDIPIDEPVWLRPDDVVAGRDTVVIAAYQWLLTQQTNP